MTILEILTKLCISEIEQIIDKVKNVKIPLLSALINLPSHPTIDIAQCGQMFYEVAFINSKKENSPNLRRSRKTSCKVLRRPQNFSKYPPYFCLYTGTQKYSRLRCLLCVKSLVFVFMWADLAVLF